MATEAPSPAPVAEALPGVKVQFKAVGSAPILKKTKFKVSASEPFAMVVNFLRRQLQLADSEPLCCYLVSAFAPSPTQNLGELCDTFGVEGEVVVHYSLTPSYG